MSVIDMIESADATPTDASDDSADRNDASDAKSKVNKDARPQPKSPRRISISVRSMVLASVICILAATAGAFAWLYLGAHDQLTARERAASNQTRAEEVAIDYAVHAAEMDYQDVNAWKLRLINGTSPELKEKLTKAADSMQQILQPLQWKSTARPLAAKVRSDTGGIFVVDSFVSVLTKTVQAPEGLQSTATYSITLDSRNNWQITDVGGIDATLRK
jgi:Mce-associated membrane protein